MFLDGGRYFRCVVCSCQYPAPKVIKHRCESKYIYWMVRDINNDTRSLWRHKVVDPMLVAEAETLANLIMGTAGEPEHLESAKKVADRLLTLIAEHKKSVDYLPSGLRDE